jgi:hypothetical protein
MDMLSDFVRIARDHGDAIGVRVRYGERLPNATLLFGRDSGPVGVHLVVLRGGIVAMRDNPRYGMNRDRWRHYLETSIFWTTRRPWRRSCVAVELGTNMCRVRWAERQSAWQRAVLHDTPGLEWRDGRHTFGDMLAELHRIAVRDRPRPERHLRWRYTDVQSFREWCERNQIPSS